jgi:hypothetical protein
MNGAYDTAFTNKHALMTAAPEALAPPSCTASARRAPRWSPPAKGARVAEIPPPREP